MTDRPIPFSAPMVAALLAGTKTQTRRIHFTQSPVMTPKCDNGCEPRLTRMCIIQSCNKRTVTETKVHTGDRLWVKESYYQLGHWEPVEGKSSKGGRQKWAFSPDADQILFDAPAGETVRLGRHHKDPSTVAWHKRLGRFMPKQYSRLTLIVTDVRVERLQAISEADAVAEGITEYPCLGPHRGEKATFWSAGDGTTDEGAALSSRLAYANLWDTINGHGAWEANPWVMAVSFSVHHGNIDQIGGAA